MQSVLKLCREAPARGTPYCNSLLKESAALLVPADQAVPAVPVDPGHWFYGDGETSYGPFRTRAGAMAACTARRPDCSNSLYRVTCPGDAHAGRYCDYQDPEDTSILETSASPTEAEMKADPRYALFTDPVVPAQPEPERTDIYAKSLQVLLGETLTPLGN
jgi:hypothetical protein